MGTRVPRILVVRPYGIGNTILATPAIQLCRHHCPDASLEALLDPLGAETLGAWPVLDRVHLYPEVPAPDAFDRIVLLEPSSPKVSAPFLDHPGLVRHWLGARRSARFLRRHEVEVNLEIAGALGRGAEPPPFSLHCAVAEPPPDAMPAPGTLGVHIGGVQPQQLAKRFPPAFWIELLTPLAAARPVLLVGGPDEAAEAASIAKAVGARSVCGTMPLAATAGVIRGCAAFVATDGGMMHVAACVGTPVVALFSTTDPWRTRPWTPAGRSIVLRVERTPSRSSVRAVRRALHALEHGCPEWLELAGRSLALRRPGRLWTRAPR
jgi:ADP-heptose:LPS heptosyltransferase